MQKEPDRLGRPVRAVGLPSRRLVRHGANWRRSVGSRLRVPLTAVFVLAVAAFALLRGRATTDRVLPLSVSTATTPVLAAAPTATAPALAAAPAATATRIPPTTDTPQATPIPVSQATSTPQPTESPTPEPTEAPTPEPTEAPTAEAAAIAEATEPEPEPEPEVAVAPTRAPAPAPAPVRQAPRPAYRTYTVQRGDILKQIAARYGVSVASIIAINTIPNPDSLRIGQVLTIPPAGS